MNPFRNRPLLFCSLILYTLFLTAALLYLRFPSEKFKIFCQTRVEQILPDTRCSISQIGLKFPLSMDINEMKLISSQSTKQEFLSIEQVRISPKMSAPKSQFDVELKACDGNHDFSLLLQQEEKKVSLKDINLTNLNLAKFPFLRQTFGREITGFLSGNGTYHATWDDDLITGNGQGSITIADGSFKLLLPILSLQKIDLKTFAADIVFQKKSLQFNSGEFQGKELKGEFSGDLALRSPIEQSRFSFEGALEPLPPLLKKSKYAQNMVRQLKQRQNRTTLPFILQGSVKRPRFKFDS